MSPSRKPCRSSTAYDKASPRLTRAAVAGIHMRPVLLSTRQSGTARKDFLVFTLSDVTVTSIQAHDDGEGPMEEVALSYGQLRWRMCRKRRRKRRCAVEFDWDTRGP